MNSEPKISAIRPWADCRRSSARALRAMALLPILAGCASQTAILPPAAATASADRGGRPVRPLACDEVKIVHSHLGKITATGQADVKKQDVIDRLALPDWEAQLRRLFGDTSETIAANKANNAALDAICKDTRPVS